MAAQARPGSGDAAQGAGQANGNAGPLQQQTFHTGTCFRCSLQQPQLRLAAWESEASRQHSLQLIQACLPLLCMQAGRPASCDSHTP